MLQPRDSDVPALFLVLVVLPVVTYILLGRWTEASKRKQRISLLAQLAAEESVRAEAMAAASVIPLVSPPKAALHECARCHAAATTRCSRCKSVRYCSGKCQILHWRNIHKDECQPLESISSSSKLASLAEPAHDQSIFNENLSQQFSDGLPRQPLQESIHSDRNDSMDIDASEARSSSVSDGSKMFKAGRRSTDKRASHKSSRESNGREDGSRSTCADDFSESKARHKPSKEAVLRNKLRGNDFANSGHDFPMMYKLCTNMVSPGQTASREQPCVGLEGEVVNAYGSQDAVDPSECGTSVVEHVTDDSVDNRKFYGVGKVSKGSIPNGEVCRPKNALHSDAIKISKSSRSVARSSTEQSYFATEKKGHIPDEPIARTSVSPAQGGNGVVSMGFMKMMGLKKSSKVCEKDASEVYADGHKKVKMLFPYEEFIKFFQYEIFDLTPRGLSNCGNSCYANAVLQCLTCTKPLIVYLLKRTHSRSCCVKRWCLMCELEQHVATLRDSVSPLSPSRILSQMRSMNCQMGDGSQEDAHEFLRVLVASMQSICLEEEGGEKHVHPSLQETTFIQHTFGGRLRSKVECLKCHHRSERCENIMDLTLEIYGWVESLEDALTQFTAWEDLDGENMYKCGRCASYVRARKQLSVDEAPNILTIVLKRFQEGSYGKINKCITFPEMLDMIPFMTGAYDIPPLYMLYAVVVHMDTLNASFSGHYVAYVKDLRGNWLRIDDSEVQPVPMSQVMSEGAYILFYMRSSPRPSHSKHAILKSSHKSSRSSVVYNSHTSNDMLRNASTRFAPMLTRTYPDFSDATSSSDWSLFTSSDDASFTTESTRDSFSTTTDYPDICNPDPVASFFNSFCVPEHSSQRTVSCRMFSGSQPITRFVHEENGYVESYEAYHRDFATYDGNCQGVFCRTPGCCYRY